ncbi:unnamed protein product [Closterium sp. NIES-53]
MASEADRLRLELRASRVECAELRSRLEAGPAGIERARYGVGGEREAEMAQRVEELTRELEAERQEAERARRFHEDELTMLLASNKDKEAVWTRKVHPSPFPRLSPQSPSLPHALLLPPSVSPFFPPSLRLPFPSPILSPFPFPLPKPPPPPFSSPP